MEKENGEPAPPNHPLTVWLILFTFSGVGGLVFQVIWTRKLGLVLGGTIQSASLTSASFLFGLSLGALLSGLWAERWRNPLLRFAQLEIFIALSGLLVTHFIPHIHPLCSSLLASEGGAYRGLVILVAFLAILLPSTAMGATLPLLTHFLGKDSARFVRVLAFLYAANTLGASAGAFLTDFHFVKWLGVNNTAGLASSLDVCVGLFALYLSRGQSGAEPVRARTSKSEESVESLSLPLLLVGVAGFCGLGLEIAWTRLLVFFNGTDIYAFSLVLSTYLLGIVIGSACLGLLGDRVLKKWLMGALLLCLGAYVWQSLYTLQAVTNFVGFITDDWPRTSRRIFACMVLILPPTILLGAIFPTAAGLVRQQSETAGMSVGKTYLWNTVGSVSGSLVTGFYLLPYFGLQSTLQVLASLTLLFGGFAVFSQSKASWRGLWLALGLLSPIVLWTATPSSTLVSFLYDRNGNRVISATDDHYGAIALIEQFNSVEAQYYKNLIVDGYNMAGNSLSARRYTTQLGLLPAVLGSEPKDVLVVCLGLANTLTLLESLDSVESIDCVELSARVVETIRQLDRVPPVLDSKKVNLIIGDGRNHLLTNSKTYDVITAEPPPPTEAGIVNLYSREYFLLCKRRLNPGGVVAHWLPTMQMSVFESQTIIKAFQDVFPHTHLFQGSGLQLVLVGSQEPLEPSFEQVKARGRGATGLEEIEFFNFHDILASHLRGPKELRRYTDSIPPLTDDRPYLQYHDGNWTPDTQLLLRPTEQPLPITWSAQADEAEEQKKNYKKAQLIARLRREFVYLPWPDIYTDLFMKTEIGKRLLENSEALLLTGATQAQRKQNEEYKSNLLDVLHLARVDYLLKDQENLARHLNEAKNLAKTDEERQLVLLYELLVSESVLPEEQKRAMLQEALQLKSLSPPLVEGLKKRWKDLL